MRAAFSRWISEEAERDASVLLLTADLGYSVFDDYRRAHPSNFLNVGVAESLMIGLAAGAAMQGRRVFTYSIATFLVYRPIEQIRVDLCYQQIPVCLVGAGGGLSYADAGATHHATEDLAVMSALPGMTVLAPGDPLEAEALLDQVRELNGPSYLRLGRGKDKMVHERKPPLQIGHPIKIVDGADVSILAIGNMLPSAMEASRKLKQAGVSAGVTSFHTLKPFSEEYVLREARSVGRIVTLEEHVPQGGLFSWCAQTISRSRANTRLFGLSLPDAYVHQSGNQDYLRRCAGLDVDSICQKILMLLSESRL